MQHKGFQIAFLQRPPDIFEVIGALCQRQHLATILDGALHFIGNRGCSFLVLNQAPEYVLNTGVARYWRWLGKGSRNDFEIMRRAGRRCRCMSDPPTLHEDNRLENDRSQRARSFIFLAYGVLAASALKRYKDGEHVDLYICENGLISINPPLTPARLGSLSTRTTHPVFLGLFQKLLDVADLRITVRNPYQFKTKGEMLRECKDQAFLRKRAAETTSCGRYARNGWQHCGRCLPCLIRRAAFHAWGEVDKTQYVYADLSKNDSQHARYDDVRCAAMAAALVDSEGLAGC